MKSERLPVVDLKTLSRADTIVRRGAQQTVREERPRPLESDGGDAQAKSLRMSSFIDTTGIARLFDSSAWSARQIAQFDFALLGVVLILVGMGTVMVYSSSSVLAAARHEDSSFYLFRHVARVGVGVLLMFAATRIPVKVLSKASGALLVLSAGLLVFLLAMKVIDPAARRRAHTDGFACRGSRSSRRSSCGLCSSSSWRGFWRASSGVSVISCRACCRTWPFWREYSG